MDLSNTCVLCVGRRGRGGRIILPVLLSVTTTSRRTRGKTFSRVRPADDHIHTNDTHKHNKNPQQTCKG